MKNKAQGMPVNVMIIAILGLVVFVILIAIFSSRAGIFSKNVGGSCTDQGGQCATNGECLNRDYPIKILATGCPYSPDPARTDQQSGQCCLPLK